MAKPKLKVVAMEDLGKEMEKREKEELNKFLELPYIDEKELEKLISITPENEEDARKEHRDFIEKREAIGRSIFKALQEKAKLERMTALMKGLSPKKKQLLDEISAIKKMVDVLFKNENLPGLQLLVEYEQLVSKAESFIAMAEAGTKIHFGHVNAVLKTALELKIIERYENMSFDEARGQFPEAVVIMYGGFAHIVSGKLGWALISLNKLAKTNGQKR